MKKPEISNKFTIEDIHKVREYNAERRKKLTLKERLADKRESANKCEKDIIEYRKKRKAI